ncbi:unnamed protein product [Adineta steineri]|uniref:Glycosyltransferase family 32 protein n=1 Tax=Adineta steineri TaxID=433720 RepID=A0A819U688_9BILA|nr:unnamed protein product [Adineta steineri]CAF4086643.1 unnamed protein product [Adineta steineri]
MYFKTCLHHILTILRSTHTRLSLLTCFSILFIFTFRYNILTLFYIGQTYVTWYRFSSGVITSKDNFDTTFSSYPINQTSARPNYTDLVPAIIHHIVIGDIDISKHPTWTASRDACLKLHPDYEYKFWNDSLAEELIRKEYSWFLETWKSYRYPIQRADSLRYLVLYHYGGIFLDMDLHCRRSLGPLRRFDFISPAAYPVGISNGFLMASAHHPFIKVLVDQLPLFNRNFIFPYATVMFSTGCMYISAQYSLYNDHCRLRLLDYKQHRLSGHVSTPLFHHYGSSSWHSGDASFIKQADYLINRLIYHQQLFFIHIFVFVIIIIYVLYRRRRTKKEEKLEYILLT